MVERSTEGLYKYASSSAGWFFSGYHNSQFEQPSGLDEEERLHFIQ
jgi:hypothetical protein